MAIAGNFSRTVASLSGSMLFLLFAGCGGGKSENAPAAGLDDPLHEFELTAPQEPSLANLKLSKPQSCQGNKDFLVDTWYKAYTQAGGYYPDIGISHGTIQPTFADGRAGGGGTASAPPVAAMPSLGSGGTNLQEAGVDEADNLKVAENGTLYTINNSNLIIVQGVPAQDMRELATLPLKLSLNYEGRAVGWASPQGLFLDSARKQLLVVMSAYLQADETTTAHSDMIDHSMVLPGRGATGILVIDVNDVSKPTVVREFIIEGNYSTTRRVGNRLSLVTTSPIALPPSLAGNQKFSEAIESLRKSEALLGLMEHDDTADKSENLNSVEAATRELVANYKRKVHGLISEAVNSQDWGALTPRIYTTTTAKTEATPLFDCGNIYQPRILSNQPETLSVSNLDLETNTVQTASAFSGGGIVYASADSLYVAQNSYSWWSMTDAREKAVIHQFDIKNSEPRYVGAGTVDGTVRGPFSLSEQGEHLRVVASQSSSRPSQHSLYIMKMGDTNELAVTGNVSGFGKGEDVMSVRFVGTRAYVVTFRRVDPLFAFDLSNPTQPKLAGELKIPGFSSYMHPIDDTHLLTVGQDATDTGRTTGVQVQLFDVSDISTPKRTHALNLSSSDSNWSSSGAEYDHHAFNFDPTSGILVLPHESHNYNTGAAKSELITLKIDVTDGIRDLGRVNHNDMLKTLLCTPSVAANTYDPTAIQAICESTGSEQNRFKYFYSMPRINRGFTLDNAGETYVYSLSNIGVKANKLSVMDAAVGSVLFKASADNFAQMRY